MFSIEEREQNLFNATDTMAQCYDEIETFLIILFGHMERAGYATKSERLRSGTVTMRNLTRRLLATAMVVYVKGVGNGSTLDDEGKSRMTRSKTPRRAARPRYRSRRRCESPSCRYFSSQ